MESTTGNMASDASRGPAAAGLDPRELARRVVRGDRSAFEQLFEAALRAAWRHATARTHKRSEAEAETEAILRRAFENLHRWEGETPFEAWLLRDAGAAPSADESAPRAPGGSSRDGAAPRARR